MLVMEMSSKTQKNPSIRFKGFTDTWEQRKLSDIVKLFGGYAFSSDDSNSCGVPWLKIANVGKNGIDWSTTSYLPDNFWLDYEAFRLFTGDYVMALTRPILNHALKIAVIDKNALLNQRVAKLIFETNDEYGFQLLQRRAVVDRIESELAGTDPPNLGSGNLKNITISITTNNDEQTKVGAFFKQLDNTIALHQRQLDSYKELKKTSMQRIFNQELRFKDKNGNDYPLWQNKRLKDLGKFYSGTGFNDKYQGYLDLSIPFFKVSDMNISSNSKYMVESNNTVDDDICREMNINKVTGPAILFAKVGAAIYMERKRIVHNDFLMDNNMMALRINDSVDIEFTYYLCQSLSFSKYAQVGALPSYNASDIGRLHCKLPVISEQKKIAIFLSTLDQKVNEAAQKVELFKELKKGLMQQMFF